MAARVEYHAERQHLRGAGTRSATFAAGPPTQQLAPSTRARMIPAQGEDQDCSCSADEHQERRTCLLL